MKHHKRNRKFGRKTDERRALLRGLSRELILRGRITTTEARAKEIRPLVEKLVTKARVGTQAQERLVLSALGGDERATRKLVKDVAPRYKERSGGYLRIVKTAPRKGDASPMALIEFV